MRNKFWLLTTTSLISSFLLGQNDLYASARVLAQIQAAKKQELITGYRNGTLTRAQVEQQAATLNIQNIAQDLFPPHWEQFFTYFNGLAYPQLLTACDQLSQGTLAQGFVGPVQANLTRTGNRGAHTLRGWLTAARDEVMNGPLQGFAERRQQLDHYIAAAEISERLGHTITADEQARIFAAIKTGHTLNAALQQSLGNIQYKGHNITPLVATEILNNRRARPQAETEAKITQEITLLLNANLGLNDDICTRVANDVIRNNRNPVDALATILNYVVEGHDITRAVANKVITASTPLDTALRQTRIEKYTELLRAKNYALTNAQYNDIAVALQHGQPTPAAFQSVLNVDACEGQEIKNTVIDKMIADNIAFADANRQVSITTRFNRLKAQNLGLSDALLQNVATAVTTENRGYVQAFKLSLPNMPFRFLDVNVDLKDSVAAALVQGRSLEAATIQARINVVKTQLGAPDNGLTPRERDDIAAKIVTEGSSIGDAFKSALSQRPEFRHVQDAELTSAVNQIVNGTTIDNAWEMACLRPQIDALRDHFRLIDDAIIQQMARHKLTHGGDDRAALIAALTEQPDLPLTYCFDLNVIAKHMMQNGSASLNSALILANQEVIEQELKSSGWGFLGTHMNAAVETCLNAPNLIEGMKNYFFSFGIKADWLDDFALYLRATRALPADAKAPFLQQKTEERLRTQYTCINNDDIIKYLTRKIVQAGTIDADITANDLKEAFMRTRFPIAREVIDDAVRALLSRQATSIEGAITYGHVCLKAREIKRDYAHLPEEECLSLASHLVDHPARIIKVALARELAKRQITDRDEVAEIIRLVLEENQTIAHAESHFGYRALMRQYPDQLTEEQARLILRECPAPLAGLKDGELTFAKYVVEERYGSTNFQFKLDSVKRLISILHNDYNKAPLDIKKPHEYQGAHAEREAVYDYMRSKGYNVEADQDFARACTELKGYLPNNMLNEDEGLNYGSAFDIYKARTAFNEDRESFSRKHEQHRQTLVAAITPDPNLNDRAAFELTHDSFDRNLFRRNLPLISRRINLLQDFQDVVGEIIDIDARHSHEPIRLNYIGLTFEDIYSAALHVEYDPITDAEFNGLKNALRVLLNKRHGPYEAIHGQFTYAFDRFSGDRDNQWKEKVSALLRRASQNLVDSAIKRPDEEGYDAGRWQTDLENQKYTMLLAIIDTTEGCDTGVNLKLGKILDANQEHLGLTIPNMPVSAALARIINSLKLERIYELGEIFSINSEHYVTEPAVARQRMRLGFSLGGNYEELVHIGFGDPDKPKNFPIQIVRNMFVPGQPVRTSGEDEDRISLPVRPHLTVKGLVDKVYGEFGKSITLADLNKVRDGDAILKSDSFKPAIDGEEGVFNTCNPMNGMQNMFFNRKMAFYLLEMHNYVSINEGLKEVLYKEPEGRINHGGRQYTFDELIDDF